MSQSANSTTVDSQGSRGLLPYIVLGLGCLFYFYEFLLQISPGVMGDELMADFSVTAFKLGILNSAYFYSYAGMQIPVGVLIDRFGPHRLLTCASLVCGVSSILFGFADSLFVASMARFMIGFGSAFAVVSTFKLAVNWFEHRRFAFITGIVVMLGMMGAITAEAPLAIAIEHYGWRYSMIYLGLAGIFIALLILLFVKDTPTGRQKLSTLHQQAPLLEGLFHVVQNKELWIVALYGGLVFLATPTLAGQWGVPYLMTKYAITKSVAGATISLIFLGWIVGCPTAGWLSDLIGRRKPLMFWGALGAFLTLSATIYLNLSMPLLRINLFLFGFCSGWFLPAFSIAREITLPRYAATGLGFMNMMNMIGIALCHPIIGIILDRVWDGSMENFQPLYSQNNYEVALSVLPMGILVALLLLPLIRETNCQQCIK